MSDTSEWDAKWSAGNPWDFDSDYETRKREHIVSLMPRQRYESVLEIGCAEGHITGELAFMADTYRAIDIATPAIDMARIRAETLGYASERLTFECQDVSDIDETDAYDLVICSEILYYVTPIAKLKAVISALRNSLRTDGYLLLAHSHVCADRPDETGFDWGTEYGAATIHDMFLNIGGLTHLARSESPLYVIDLARKRTGQAAPRVCDIPIVAPPPSLCDQIRWREPGPLFLDDSIAIGDWNEACDEERLVECGIGASLSVTEDLRAEYHWLSAQCAGLVCGPGNTFDTIQYALDTALGLQDVYPKILVYSHSAYDLPTLVACLALSVRDNRSFESVWNDMNAVLSSNETSVQFTSRESELALLGAFKSWCLYKREAQNRDLRITTELPILMYHDISDTVSEYSVSPEMFERQLDWLQTHGYRSVSMEDWDRAMETNVPLPVDAVHITFDDGCRGVAEHAYPLLKIYGFGASVFVVTECVGQQGYWDSEKGSTANLMDWESIRSLREDGIEIGCHTARHMNLTELSVFEVPNEIGDAKTEIENRLGCECGLFAYPFGTYNPFCMQTVADAGFRFALTSDSGKARLSENRMKIPRLEVRRDTTMTDFAKMMSAKSRFPPQDPPNRTTID